jgi:4-amino-4-deoxy-L-arabinose transferase-like glycosyltransferase
VTATPTLQPTATDEGVLPRTNRGRYLVLALLGLALLLRVGVVLENRHEYRPLTDAAHFDLIAGQMADGKGFEGANLPPTEGPSAIRAPGYPAVLAAVYLVFGNDSWTMGRLLNAAIGTALVALVGLVAAQLWSRREGLLALAMAAVYPPLILVGSSLQLEPLLVSLALAALAVALHHRRRPSGLLWPVVAGVLLGLAVLTRELAFAFLVPVVWLVWPSGEDGRRHLTREALMAPLALVVAAFLVVVPWTARNAVQLDAFVPITTSAGFGLVGTYNDTSRANDAQWIQPYDDPELAELMLAQEHPTEVELDGVLRDYTVDYIREHPGYPVEVAFWNTVRMFELDQGDYSLFISQFVPYPRYLTKASILSFYALAVLAAIGLFMPLTRRIPKVIWVAPVLSYVVLVVLLPGSVRYRASLEPFFILLATATAAWVLDRFAPRLGTRSAAGTG